MQLKKVHRAAQKLLLPKGIKNIIIDKLGNSAKDFLRRHDETNKTRGKREGHKQKVMSEDTPSKIGKR